MSRSSDPQSVLIFMDTKKAGSAQFRLPETVRPCGQLQIGTSESENGKLDAAQDEPDAG